MRILITNDDGIDAPGILALYRALKEVADVAVLAPDRNWSAAGHQRTLNRPLRVHARPAWAEGALAYASDGTPSDCVTLSLLGAIKFRPQLVVSGINRGGNLGHDVLSSGTVAAAMEAVVMGVPAIAISLNDWERDHFDAAGQVAVKLVDLVKRHGIPTQTMLNVNVPALPAEEIKGLAVTRLGTRLYRQALIERQDPFGVPYYWIGGSTPEGLVDEEGTDFWAVEQGHVSITPLSVNRTSEDVLVELEGWNSERSGAA